MAEIKLGDTVQDMVSGLKGIAVARTYWLFGVSRITLQPPVDKDGQVPKNYCCDEPQVSVINEVSQGVAV